MNNDYCVYLERRQVKKQVEVCRDVCRVCGPGADEVRRLVIGILEKCHPDWRSLPAGGPVIRSMQSVNGLFGQNCAAGYDPETGEVIF
jgi:hypothetical protein